MSFSSSKSSPSQNTGGTLTGASAQAVGGSKNIVNTGTLNQIQDSSKKTITTNIGNSTVTVKGSGSINYNTTTNGLTGNDLVAFENQIAGSLNSGNTGGGFGSDIAVGNPTPTAAQQQIAATSSWIKWAIGAAAALGLAFIAYLFFGGRKKRK